MTWGTKTRIFLQSLTLAPTIKLQAKIASEEDKQWLAGSLHQLKQTSTGSLEGDVVKFSVLVDEWVRLVFVKIDIYEYF
jgi:hypothetical protein